MRDLAAQVTSSLLRFPEVTIDALGEDEVTLDSVLHGRFTVGEFSTLMVALMSACLSSNPIEFLCQTAFVGCLFILLFTSHNYCDQGRVDWPGSLAGPSWRWSMQLLASVFPLTALAGCQITHPQCWLCGTSVG